MTYIPSLWWIFVFPLSCVLLVAMYWAGIVAVNEVIKRASGKSHLALSCLVIAVIAALVTAFWVPNSIRPTEISALIWVPFLIAALTSGFWVKSDRASQIKMSKKNG